MSESRKVRVVLGAEDDGEYGNVRRVRRPVREQP